MHTLRCVQYVGVCDILTWKINLNGPSLPPLPRHMRLQEVKQVCSCLNGKVHSPTHTNTHQHSHTHPIKILSSRVKEFQPKSFHSTGQSSVFFSRHGPQSFWPLWVLLFTYLLILSSCSHSFFTVSVILLIQIRRKKPPILFSTFPGLTFIHRLKFFIFFLFFYSFSRQGNMSSLLWWGNIYVYCTLVKWTWLNYIYTA